MLDEIKQAAGPGNVDITLGYVGVQPSSYPINTIFLWTGGSHEGVLQVALQAGGAPRLEDFEEKLAPALSRALSRRRLLVRAGRYRQPHHELRRANAGRSGGHGAGLRRHPGVCGKGAGPAGADPSLRDLQYEQTLDYPGIQVDVDRQMAGQLGVTVDQVGRSFAAATSSSRFVAPNYWADPRTGIAFQVQVEVPQPQMTSLEDLRGVPVTADRASHPLLGDVARSRTAPSSANTTA